MRQLSRSLVSVARSIVQMLLPVSQAHQAQTGGHCLPGSSWDCTSVFGHISCSMWPTRRRGRVRSLSYSLLNIRSSRCVTVGDHSFAAAAGHGPLDTSTQGSLSRPTTLEQSTWWSPIRHISHSVSSNTLNSLFRKSYWDIVFFAASS